MDDKKQAPGLRFRGFEGEWEEKKLGDIVKRISTGRSSFRNGIEKSEENRYPVLGSTSIISYDRNYDYSGKFILIARVGANTGSLYRYSGNVKISDNTIYMESDNLDFRYYGLQKSKLKQKSFGSGQPLIKASELKSLNISNPSNFEQEKIGAFFAQLDKLIALHVKKLANLKEMKKGYLQQMFPAPGQKIPQLRFQGFEGEWEEKRLGDLVCFSKGKGYTKKDLKISGTPIILYGRLYTDYTTTIFSNKLETYVELKKGSIISEGREVVIPSSGESSEDIARASEVRDKGIILGGDLNILKPNNLLDSTFLALNLSNGSSQKELTKKAQGKTVVHLHNSDLSTLNISFPSYIEQEKIGTFFADFDKNINLTEKKLEQLKTLKKGFLQQMFI
ncbi:restriction endonuclease subunit S [Streptococcaceae bacterium ESL0729]|nr:restriction endonuclease subunit S [Streptococcaceae bacterium ESL0729]